MSGAAALVDSALRICGIIRRGSRLRGLVCRDGQGGVLLVELEEGTEGFRIGDAVALVENQTALVHNGRRLRISECAWGVGGPEGGQ